MTRTDISKHILAQVLEAYGAGLTSITIHFDGTVDDEGEVTLREVIEKAFAPKTEMEHLFRSFGGPA